MRKYNQKEFNRQVIIINIIKLKEMQVFNNINIYITIENSIKKIKKVKFF